MSTVTGTAEAANDPAEAGSRAAALNELRLFNSRITKVRAAVRNERQVARRTEMYLELVGLRDKRRTAREVVRHPKP